MAPILLIACTAKYPSLLIGLLYPAKTGKTLLQSYRQQGWWALGIYLMISLYSMWFVLAAIAITTAGLVQALMPFETSVELATAGVLGIAVLTLLSGHYQGLEHVSKVLIGLLALLLPIATIMVLPETDFSPAAWSIETWDLTTIAFIIALTGWMPIPIDASVMTSTWVASRNESSPDKTTTTEARIDFNVGYTLTILFALCFLVLGASIMPTNGTPLPAAAGSFAVMVIEMFTRQLGQWSYYLIGTIALVTMFTTLLAVMDGQSRVIMYASRTLRPSQSWGTRMYSATLLIYALGGMAIVTFFMRDFSTFINFATSLGFLMAPVAVVLNHRAMFAEGISQEYKFLYWGSITGGTLLCMASSVYFYLIVFT
jgi:Mn2+/Fe2+ NRAMP family transporter